MRTKVTVVSSDKKSLQDITRVLARDGDLGEIVSVEGDAQALEKIVDAPDLLVINGALAEEGGLDTLERLGHLHPETAFIVVSENQSADFLLRAMRAGVREIVACPIVDDQFLAAVARIRKRGAALGADGKVLAFISCKGGAGSTFLATNFGYALATNADSKVAFIDLNLQFGDATLFVSEQRPPTDIAQLSREIHRLDPSLLAASMVNILPNYSLLAAPEDPAHAIDVKAQHVETILKLARRQYDFVIVDLGRSLDAVSLQALDMADMIFPVLQVTLPFVRDGKRLLGVLRSLGYPKSKINLLVNRFEKDGDITLADLESNVGASVFKTIPNSYKSVATSVNQGVPIIKLASKDPVSRSLYELMHTVAPRPAQDSAGWLSKLLGHK
jgi:pilus assembly protein CpaE